MSQTVIIDKIIEFLKQRNTKESLELAEKMANKKPDKGLCYSFALCRAAMRLSGKLAWWEDALDKIAKWDETSKSLEKLHTLVQSEDKTTSSLENIFDKIANYLLFNYAYHGIYPHIPLNQTTFLKKNEHGFELLHKNRLLIPDKTYAMAGHFGSKTSNILKLELNDPVNQHAIQNNMCLLHCSSGKNLHTCELSYDDADGWLFYDPNYEDNKPKVFKDVDALIKEIRRVLGDDFLLEIHKLKPKLIQSDLSDEKLLATHPYEVKNQIYQVSSKELPTEMSEPSFEIYHSQLQKKPNDFIEGFGLHVIARLVPETISNMNQQNVNAFYINIGDKSGWTPLMYAALSDHPKAVDILIKIGADPNLINSDNLSPLYIAAGQNKEENINILREHGANLDSALSLAIKSKNYRAINNLIKAGADPNPVLIPAIRNKDTQSIENLIKLGVNPDLPLIFSICDQDTPTIRKLLAAGADPQIGLLAAKQLWQYQFDPPYKKWLNKLLFKTEGPIEKKSLREILHNKPALVKAISATYAFIDIKSILKVHSKKKAELFIENLLKLPKHDSVSIQLEALRYIKGDGPYGGYFRKSPSSHSINSRLNFLYDSGLFDSILAKLPSASFSEKNTNDRKLIKNQLMTINIENLKQINKKSSNPHDLFLDPLGNSTFFTGMEEKKKAKKVKKKKIQLHAENIIDSKPEIKPKEDAFSQPTDNHQPSTRPITDTNLVVATLEDKHNIKLSDLKSPTEARFETEACLEADRLILFEPNEIQDAKRLSVSVTALTSNPWLSVLSPPKPEPKNLDTTVTSQLPLSVPCIL